jgi:serine/threonine protein kinase
VPGSELDERAYAYDGRYRGMQPWTWQQSAHRKGYGTLVESTPSPVQSRLVAGRYRLISPLGSGGMGTVWRAEDVVLGREVAVKEVTFPHGISDEDREVLRERTRREARAAARLDHPSAVTVYDVVEDGNAPYLVMELVEARTLSQVVRTDGPLTPQRTAQVGLALLGALEAAHRQGIVHRDVKPGNVLLCPDSGGTPGRVVLTDFGIASSPGDSSITSTGLLLGSPSYISPERARGLPPGPASDLWSLGATLFTAVEGRPPYDGGEPLLTVTAVVTGEHAPFVAAGPLVPVIEGLIERDPERRLDVAAARAALRPIASTPHVSAPPAPSPSTEGRGEHTSALPMRDVQAAAASDLARDAAARPAQRGWERPPRVLPAAAPVRRSPDGGSRSGHRRTPLVLAGVVLLLALAGLGYVLSRDGGGADSTTTAGSSPDAVASSVAPSADPSPSAPAASTPSPAASPSAPPPVASGIPAGWTSYTDPNRGYTLGVPPGYTQSTRNGLVQFRDEANRRTLRIDFSSTPDADGALAAWTKYSPALAGRLPQYQELRLEEVEYKGLDAADLEFTYVEGTKLRVLDRTFVSGGEGFALYWQVRAEDWDAARPLFDQIAATFQPRAA